MHMSLMASCIAPPNDPPACPAYPGGGCKCWRKAALMRSQSLKLEDSLENFSSFIAPLPWNERAHTEYVRRGRDVA
jgi:hypothetical protein